MLRLCNEGSPPFILARRHRMAPAAYPFRLLRFLRIHAGRMMRVNAFQENVCPDRNIFGLATHKVYPHPVSPRCTVGSYPTFSPLPRLSRGGYFLWHFLFIPAKAGIPFPLGSMAPCVVPTFLTRLTAGAAERAASQCKGTTKMGVHKLMKQPTAVSPQEAVTKVNFVELLLILVRAPTTKAVGSIDVTKLEPTASVVGLL
jgi:hypothetical protein